LSLRCGRKDDPASAAWVRRFFAQFTGLRRRDLGRVEIEAFLSEMVRRNEISNWQIAQARGCPLWRVEKKSRR
jgi:hypothetical protein